jgi:hypothetical protein
LSHSCKTGKSFSWIHGQRRDSNVKSVVPEQTRNKATKSYSKAGESIEKKSLISVGRFVLLKIGSRERRILYT